MDFKTLNKYTKNLRLLYIEDDEEICKQSVELLELFFEDVIICYNGEEALETYKSDLYLTNRLFDIIITDIHMPKMDGIELIENVLRLNPKQAITVISADGGNSFTLLKLINLGINSFLLKPLKENQLIDTLYKASKNLYNEKIALQYNQKITTSNLRLEQEIKRRTKRLKEQLYTDNLTGLKNRSALGRDIDNNSYNMIALIDIDRFQFINDLYGAKIGNQVIREFTSFLKKNVDKTHYKLYRTSGDEFAICHKGEDALHFENFIINLSKSVTNLPLFIQKLTDTIYLDATIGLSFEKKQLLTNCDIALRHAKKNKKPLIIYRDEINTLKNIKDALEWKYKIRHALENDNIIPIFQPIVDKEGEILKYEALMRLKEHTVDGEQLVSPSFFLETAVLTKQYPKLSHTIIKKSLQHLIKNDITLSINLTYSDFIDEQIITLITDILDKEEIGNRLIFEIVESEDIKDYALLQSFIEKFRKYGVKIAIDDFGSGFSNFGNIIQTKPDYLKIDGSLIKNIDTSSHTQTMVRAIMQIANELDIKIIAEFVHSKEVFEALHKFDIDEFQGNYFYEPSTALIEKKGTIKLKTI